MNVNLGWECAGHGDVVNLPVMLSVEVLPLGDGCWALQNPTWPIPASAHWCRMQIESRP